MCVYIYIYIKFCHIVIIINSKLEIGHNILKNVQSQNRLNRTLYTTLNRSIQHM